MDFWSKLGLALALAGIGISIVAFFGTYLWRELPRWSAVIGLVVGVSMCIVAVICFEFIPEPTEPEVTLEFVNQTTPQLQLLNVSIVTASNIKWMIAAADIDRLSSGILPIPATMFDFLTPNNKSLPINLFEPPTRTSSIVKNGDRIIGSAGINCPTCRRGHTFLFFITLGQGGWFSEREDIINGNIIFAADVNRVDEFRQLIEKIPEKDRVQIGNSATTDLK